MKKELLQMVWKVLRPFVEEALEALVALTIERIRKRIEDLLRERAEQAKAKADSAASKAQSATDPIDAARQAGKEEAWREIAGHYKRDIESLRSELSQLRRSLENSGRDKLNEVESSAILRLTDGRE